MRCAGCPRASGDCLGERVPHLCAKPGYRDYLAAYEPGRPRVAPDAGGAVVIRSYSVETGFGRMGRMLAKALEAVGQPIRYESIDAREDLDPFLRARSSPPAYSGPRLQLVPHWGACEPGDAVFSMWETDRLPGGTVATFNRARVVIVPCSWNAEVFRSSGVTAPIRVVPLGVDPCAFRPTAPEPDRFTVLSVGAICGGGHRKGMGRLIAAFDEAFRDRPDLGARLVVKIKHDNHFEDPGLPWLAVDRTEYDDAGLAALYASASVVASMTAAEGWYLPGLEGMACGRPYLGPVHTGIADYFRAGCGYAVASRRVEARGPYFEGHGHWYEPIHGSAVRQLRRACFDPDRRAKGEAAALRAAEFSWEASARKLLAVLREFKLAPEPTPGLDREIRLTKLRRACPHATKPDDCGCSDERICGLGKGRGGRASRADCFACLEGG